MNYLRSFDQKGL